MPQRANRCEHCGAKQNVNGCRVCGAQICCPSCCRVATMEAQLEREKAMLESAKAKADNLTERLESALQREGNLAKALSGEKQKRIDDAARAFAASLCSKQKYGGEHQANAAQAYKWALSLESARIIKAE